MELTALDTSVVVASLLTWHEHHGRALAVLVATRASASGSILPLPVLIESYAVLTRLPPNARLTPSAAWRMLEVTFAKRTTIPALDGAAAWNMLGTLPAVGIAGGATYDAHILACAMQAGAERLATFNCKHFQRLELDGIELVVP